MADNIVIHIPPMPKPKDFGVEPNTDSNTEAHARWKEALQAWERAVAAIAKANGKK